MKSLTYLLPAAALAAVMSTGDARADEDYTASAEPLDLTIFFHFYDRFAFESDWPVVKKAGELTNVHLKSVTSSATTDSSDAFNLMIAQGDLPDIAGGVRDDFIRYGIQGAFMPLWDLVEKDAPHIKAFFDEHPDMKNIITAPDGNVYYIPYIQDGKFSRAWWIRQDWLDKLGLDVPTTPDEVYKVLKAFREQDPNGNGIKDEVPYLARNINDAVRLINLWDARVSGSDTYGDFAVYDGKIEHPWAREEYHTGMSHLAQWYKEGLIDPEIFTRGARAREFLFGNDLGGMTHDWFASTSTYNQSLKDKIPGFSLVPMLPPHTVSGRQFEDSRRQIVMPDGWAITTANQHPDETMKYFDFWFTEFGRRMANFGIEGETYTMEDGKPTFTDEVLNSGEPVNAQMWAIGAQIPRGFFMDYDYERQWTNPVAVEGMDLYEKCDCLMPDFTGVALTEDERKVFDRYWPSIDTYMREMQQTWLLGGEDVDAGWDAYQARLQSMGYDKVIEVMQKAYDRQYGGN